MKSSPAQQLRRATYGTTYFGFDRFDAVVAFALAIPAAYRMAFYPTLKTLQSTAGVDVIDQDDAGGGCVDSALYPSAPYSLASLDNIVAL